MYLLQGVFRTMPVKMEPFFLRRWLFLQKSSNIYVGKGSKYTSAAVSISCIVIKNVKISHTNTNLFNDFSGNTLYVNIPDSLQLTKTNQFENTFTYQKRLYTKHFCNIFPTKTHLFHRPHVSFWLEVSLFVKRKLDLFS